MKKKRYHGFPLIEETLTDGWCFGAVTEFLEPGGCSDGDGYVEAPDGSRAGLVWDVEPDADDTVLEITPAENKDDWGLYQVFFSKRVTVLQDMIDNFREALPSIQSAYNDVQTKFTK